MIILGFSGRLPSPLGVLGRLPREVRELIWDALLVMNAEAVSAVRTVYRPRLRSSVRHITGIMTASHQLSREFLALMYQRRTLTFCVARDLSEQRPGPYNMLRLNTGYWSPQQRRTINDYSCLFKEHRVIQRASGNVRAMKDATGLPFNRFHHVVVDIEYIPGDQISGELVMVWNHLVAIVDFLASMRPRKVSIVVRCDGFSYSFGDRLADRWRTPLCGREENALSLLLKPFYRLRHVAELEINIPEAARRWRHIQKTVQELEFITKSDVPFGYWIGANEVPEVQGLPDDDAIASIENSWTIWLDYSLDDLDGEAAATARWTRFNQWSVESWTSWWEKFNGEDRGMGVPRFGAARLASTENTFAERAFWDRRTVQQAYYPLLMDSRGRSHFERLRHTGIEGSDGADWGTVIWNRSLPVYRYALRPTNVAMVRAESRHEYFTWPVKLVPAGRPPLYTGGPARCRCHGGADT